jgi:Na+/H+ antiporter NhaD/arsenite permease-like protein
VVSNGAGMLTPLGDPPLFLGFLRGVPFGWTFARLLGPWALVNAALLAMFYALDVYVYGREQRERVARSDSAAEAPFAGSQAAAEASAQPREPLRIDGAINFVWLAGVIALIYVLGRFGHDITSSHDLLAFLQTFAMLGMAGLSIATTSREVRAANRFGWAPIVEVAVIFIGIFITMVPALKFLEARGAAGDIPVDQAWQFFWMTGMLSSFLDNAPTYLTFATLAVGVVNRLDPTANLDAARLDGLAAHPLGAAFLVAISCGAVFMGANTYIGNGPNFMVKAIAEENGVRMPSFFGYFAWAVAILVPLFIGVTFIFFRPA